MAAPTPIACGHLLTLANSKGGILKELLSTRHDALLGVHDAAAARAAALNAAASAAATRPCSERLAQGMAPTWDTFAPIIASYLQARLAAFEHAAEKLGLTAAQLAELKLREGPARTLETYDLLLGVSSKVAEALAAIEPAIDFAAGELAADEQNRFATTMVTAASRLLEENESLYRLPPAAPEVCAAQEMTAPGQRTWVRYIASLIQLAFYHWTCIQEE